MKKIILLTLTLIALLFIATGCAPSYQSLMEDVAADNKDPKEVFNSLKAAGISDEQDTIKLQSAVLYASLKTPDAPFQEEAQNLFNLLGNETDISAASQGVQVMVYLGGIATNNNNFNSRIDRNIRVAVDELCAPPNKLGHRIMDVQALREAYYSYYLSQTCQSVIRNRPANYYIVQAMEIRKRLPRGDIDNCSFTSKTHDRLFFAELMACRLKSRGVDITDIEPYQEAD